MNCPKCNFEIPNAPQSPSTINSSGNVRLYKKKKITIGVGEGEDGKPLKEWVVMQPTSDVRDDYIELTNELSKQRTVKRLAFLELDEKIAKFYEQHNNNPSPADLKMFSEMVKTETERINKLPSPSNRDVVEFFLGKIDEQFWKDEFIPEIQEAVIEDWERLCNMEEARKNLESLLPQTQLLTMNLKNLEMLQEMS